MSQSFYYEDDCAIVSVGSVLPQALGPEEFWMNISQNKSAIGPMSEDRHQDFHYSPYRELDDKSYSKFGAEITEETYVALREKHGLNKSRHSHLDIMTIEAVAQALQGVHIDRDKMKLGLILGIMNPDELLFANLFETERPKIKERVLEMMPPEKKPEIERIFQHYTDKAQKDFVPQLETLMTTSTLATTQAHFGLKGLHFTVDAACASSLASIDICMKKLKTRELDFALAGGSESNLSPGAFVLFSKVGALAVERCLPFDKKSDGLTQGEGSVVYGLKRLKDAIAHKDRIWGVIRSCGASSDGRVASLFQPSLGGQMLAYNLAYQNIENKKVDFIELHGTGTKIGDASEAQSLSSFFKEVAIPVGSIKSLVGHTKSTAGATGLLKCLLMMKERLLIGSPYVNESVLPATTSLFVNTQAIKLEKRETPYRCGVSSFGFGGCNYHMVVDSYREDIEVKPSQAVTLQPMALVGSARLELKDFDPQWFTSKDSFYRLPPKSLPQIDKVQLLAVKATELALKSAGIATSRLNSEKVAVISASTIGLEILEQMSMRISLDSMAESAMVDKTKGEFQAEDLEALAKVFLQLKEEYDPVTEDSGPGILNNVIAGRVCNAFNFKGRNLNIDCDQASIAATFDMVQTELSFESDSLYIVIGVEESVSVEARRIRRQSVTAYLLTSPANAKAEMFPVQNIIEVSTNGRGAEVRS